MFSQLIISLSSVGREVDYVSFPMLIITIVAFLILLLILAKFAWPIILKNLDDREKKINDAILKVQLAEENFKKSESAVEDALKKANKEAYSILEKSRKSAEIIKNEIEEEAKKQAQKITQNAQEELEQLKTQVAQSLKKDAVDMALQLTEKILKKNFDKKKNDEFIKNIIN